MIELAGYALTMLAVCTVACAGAGSLILLATGEL